MKPQCTFRDENKMNKKQTDAPELTSSENVDSFEHLKLNLWFRSSSDDTSTSLET